MMKTTIKERLAAGEEVRVMVFGALASPKLAEVAGLAGGLHGIWIDQEHSAVPHHTLELLLMACRAAGLDAFVRVPPTDYGTIMRPMETGASGIMVAQIRTVEQVKQVLDWAKYPPLGVRGLFMNNYEAGYGTANVKEHVAKANRDRWICIQIETPEAVQCADRIAALEAEQQALHARLGDPAFYQQNGTPISQAKNRLAELEHELSEAYSRWEALEGAGAGGKRSK